MSYEKIFDLVTKVDDFVWGPAMLVLLVGTGIFLTLRVGFLTWRNLGYAIKSTLSKGCFSNEAGMGSAAITAAAATTDHPVRQAYINMTGTFWDTIVVCSITGLCIASSGMLGQIDPATGSLYTGSALTIAAFKTVLGPLGGWLVTIGIALFAFSTIIGWEYHGEKAFEYLLNTHKLNIIYRLVFSCVVFFGATMQLDLV